MQEALTGQPSSSMPQSGASIQSNLAMTVALISWAMLFATLFMIYAVARASSATWPPMGLERVSLVLPSISTGCIFFSSFFLFDAERKFNRGQNSFLSYVLALSAGMLFIVFQFIFWSKLKSVGIYAGTGIFGSLIYGFTWIHAAHIVLGLIGLLWLLPVFYKNRGSYLRVKNVAKFWHFLGIIWLIMYLFIFVY